MTTSPPTADLVRRQFTGALRRHRDTLDLLPALEPELARAAERCVSALCGGGKLLICGNGGSAADAQHFAAELTGRFRRERAPLAALALTTDSSALTCIGNDYDFADVFARQVRALARPGDVLVGISTSGSSPNVRRALSAAREIGAHTVLLSGDRLPETPAEVDVLLAVPADRTAQIQEMHILLIHVLCETIDDALLGVEA
ncbi:D-sedoheptulose 7-phosphate isomerase [Deinococcus metalli]|uniref:Phosphoheptose isomerase n=1 Tax=Deinococcus metalli TaxID=1141878 RepID=A0A7W8KJ90_9DEIO|nr:D-sedoheptulose 7-phosphate isomerase [Deinococcus metalli]MBB5377971.1 D-sedoheptulose 7-phosphate isomerase [Deinococcus metalli]GHF53451.1 phosphoheptose isomerase [Deinococcus metalli]